MVGLEQSVTNETKLSLQKQSELSTSLNNYARNVSNFASEVKNLPEMNRKKGIWEIRSQQLSNECERMRQSFSKFLTSIGEREQEEREQLLGKNVAGTCFFLNVFRLLY